MRWAVDDLPKAMREQAQAKLAAGARVRTCIIPDDDRRGASLDLGTPNKFGAKKVMFDGQLFHSIKEADRWRDLRLLEKAREIQDLRRQVRFGLTVNGEEVCAYVADFVYYQHDKRVVEDVKGYKGGVAYQLFRVKARLMRAVHGLDVREL